MVDLAPDPAESTVCCAEGPANSPVEGQRSLPGLPRPVGCASVTSRSCMTDDCQPMQWTGQTPPLRLMQITWSLVAGGSEMYAYKIARGLDPRKYHSFMCALDQGGALEPEIEASGIPYFIMDRHPGIHLTLMWRLFRLFHRLGIDAVQTHHFNQLFYAAIGATLVGARIVHTEHSIEYLKRRKYRWALRLLSIFCYRVIAIGTEGADCLRNQVAIPGRKIDIIHAGVEPAALQGSRLRARQVLGLSQQDLVPS